MRRLLAIAFGVSALLALSMAAGTAQWGPDGPRKLKNWTWGPATCVHVRFLGSRQTRYAGAPRCRRVAV